MNRRHFVRQTGGLLGAAAVSPSLLEAQAGSSQPGPIAALQPLPPVPAITDDERKARIEKARRLMAENKIDAIFLEGGTSMFYFTGVRWGNSERTFGVVIPQKGELAWVTPAFEEARARELIKFSNDVRIWQEDESPYAVIAKILKDRGAGTGKIGMEERVRFFIFDGVRQLMPQATFVSATPVTAGCRMIKSPAEIALTSGSARETTSVESSRTVSPETVFAFPALNSRAPLMGKRNWAAPLLVAGSRARCQLETTSRAEKGERSWKVTPRLR